MAPDERPFLAAALARPDDDGPRLVLADFLDETGDPADAARAGLVRAQVALARLPDDHPRQAELVDAAAALLPAARDAWAAAFGGLVAGLVFHRGLPEEAVVAAGTFVTRGAELFGRTDAADGLPLVRRVQLRDPAVALPDLVDCPALARVRELDLCAGDLGNGGVNLLARSPLLAGLRALDLGFNGVDDAGVALLAKAPALGDLRDLALNDNHVTPAGVDALAAAPFAARLESLDLSGNDITDTAVRALGSGFPRLTALRLANNPVGDAGLAALVDTGLADRLVARAPRLDLAGTGLGPDAAARLASWPGLGRVAALDLTGNYLGDRGLAALLGSPHLGRLRVLRVGRNQVTDAGAVAAHGPLAGTGLEALRVLDLAGNRLTRYGIGVLREVCGRRPGHPVAVDLSGNVHAAGGGEAPVPVGDVLDELRRRIAHPARRPDRGPPR